MKIHCVNNKGIDIRPYEYESIDNDETFGRFGASGFTQYGIEIGQEYLVMGIVIFQTYQAYLIDDNGFILTCPCQLFEILDDRLDSDWHFRVIDKDEDVYPFIQAIFGYPELCSDKKSYENLIIEKKENTERVYFRQKMKLEDQC